MSKAKTTKEVLKAAKWMLENVGWNKGEFAKYSPNGTPISFCAAGAINRVEVNNDVLRGRARDKVSKTVGQNLVHFNDHPDTTKEQVLLVFDQAITPKKKGKKS